MPNEDHNMHPNSLIAGTKNLQEHHHVDYKHGLHEYKTKGILTASRCPIYNAGIRGECCDPERDPNGPCTAVQDLENGLIEQIMALPHIQPTDKVLVDSYARNTAYLYIIDRYIMTKGIVDETGKVEPVLKLRWTINNTARREAETLGLTPLARAKLNLDTARTVDIATMLSKDQNHGHQPPQN